MRTNKLLAIPFSEKKLKITSVAADLEVKNGETSQVVLEIELEGEPEKLQAYEPKIRRTNDVLEINLELETNHVSFVSLARSKVLRVNKAIITLPPTEELTRSGRSTYMVSYFLILIRFHLLLDFGPASKQSKDTAEMLLFHFFTICIISLHVVKCNKKFISL